jgi:tetraacyldisaccharide 4'-kinase
VIWIAERLLSAGWRVAVLSRGYRRRSAAARLLVSDGRQLLVSPADAGDEPYLIATRCPQAIVAVGSNRYKLGQWVMQQQPVDCYLLDDGFQHLGLRRDVDLLLVDASDLAGLSSLLPAGRLREPLEAVRRATAVLLTRADSMEDADRVWRTLYPHLAQDAAVSPIHVAFVAEKLVNIRSGMVMEKTDVGGRTAVAFSGIGNAASFRRVLERLGLKLMEEIIFRDHHAYAQDDLERVKAAARRHAVNLIVTTEKDAVKVQRLLNPQDQIWAVRLACEVLDGRERLEQLILGHDA